MHLIRTSAELASLCQPPLDPELRTLLGAYAAALEEFGEDLSADIVIVEAGDTLTAIERAFGWRLVAEGRFAFPIELITEHAAWYDIVWITSDDGSGVVLLIEKGGDTDLIEACRSALNAMGEGT